MVAGGVAGVIGSIIQAKEAELGRKLTQEEIDAAKLAANQSAGSSMSRLDAQVPGALANIDAGYTAGTDFLTQGLGQQRADILQSGQLGQDAVTQGMGGALASISGGVGGAGDLLMNRQDRAGAMLDQPGGMYGNYQADPGYQFRLQQGEDAMRRMQAAQGGRFGGAAMKALVDYNQNAASQEFGNYANRANSEFGARSGSDAMDLQGRGQAANIYAQGGRDAANTYMGGAGQLADITGRTGTQLGANAAGAGAALGGAASQYFGQLASLPIDIAKQDNAYDMSAGGVPASLVPTSAVNNQAGTPYAGGAANAVGNTITGLAQIPILAEGFGQNQPPVAPPGAPVAQPMTTSGTDAFTNPAAFDPNRIA